MDKPNSSKEQRLLEMFLKEYITETEFYKMREKIKKSKRE